MRNDRQETAISLRDAALALLHREGQPDQGRLGTKVFEPHTPQGNEPRLSLSLLQHPHNGSFHLSVWATSKGKHAKVLSINWHGERVELLGFRRGEWEAELKAMARAQGIAVH